MVIIKAESCRETPMSGKCYRIVLELHLDNQHHFRWNIMCYERPSMMSMINYDSSVPPENTWEVTVKDFPEDMERTVEMLKQKIIMNINESFDGSLRDYKRFVIN